MSDIGLPDLTGKVILDTSSLDAAVTRASGIGSAVGSAVGSFAGNVATGALDKVVGFATGSVDAFAGLEDSTAAAGVLFGSAAGHVEDFASRATSAYGLSNRASIEASSTFGTFGKAAGLQGAPLAEFATNLTGLAGDLASFKGTSTEQAVEAVGAALRGESEPIRAYGVLLDDATLRQEAMALGLTKTTNEALTPQQKVLAAQSAILKQTGDAQGDFARTADSTANTQKRLTAESENQQAVLGSKLAPAMTALREALIVVVSGITGFLEALGRMGAFVSDNALAFALIGSAVLAFTFMVAGSAIATGALNAAMTVVRVATIAWTAVQWLLNAALTANPIGLIVVGIALLVGALILAWNNSETFRSIVLSVWAAVSGAVSTAISAVVGFIGNLIRWVQTAWNATVAFVSGAINAWNSFNAAVAGAIAAAVGFIASLPGRAVSALASLGSSIAGVARSAWQSFADAVTERVQGTISYVSGIPGRIIGALGNLAGSLFNSGWSMIQGLAQGITSGFQAAIGAVQSGLSNLRSFFPFSPAKQGPFSGSGWTYYSGLAIGDSVADGLDTSMGRAADAAAAGATAVRAALATDAVDAGTLAARSSSSALLSSGTSRPSFAVRVFIGDRELTEIIDVQVEAGLGDVADSMNRGVTP